jgi:hypothetical protein
MPVSLAACLVTSVLMLRESYGDLPQVDPLRLVCA